MAQYAIDYVLGASTHVLIVEAEDRDDAFYKARSHLYEARLFGASLQGSARPASYLDLHRAAQSKEDFVP